jgi:hypothetical protein
MRLLNIGSPFLRVRVRLSLHIILPITISADVTTVVEWAGFGWW